MGEIIRHVTPATLARFNDYRLSELRVSLTAVIDLRDPTVLALPADVLLDDTDYRVPRALTAAAREWGAEAMIVPSATRLGENLIVFPDRLAATSELTVVGSRDPRLRAEWSPWSTVPPSIGTEAGSCPKPPLSAAARRVIPCVRMVDGV